MNVLNHAACFQECTRIFLKRGTYNERGPNPERSREEMNQFTRAVADENHVWIQAAALRQFVSELPAIGVRIVHDLLECRSDRTEHRCGRTQRVDAGAKINDLLDGNSLFLSGLIDIPAVSRLIHLFTIEATPHPAELL